MIETSNVRLKLSCSLCKGYETNVVITYVDAYNIKAKSSPDVVNELQRHFKEGCPDCKVDNGVVEGDIVCNICEMSIGTVDITCLASSCIVGEVTPNRGLLVQNHFKLLHPEVKHVFH